MTMIFFKFRTIHMIGHFLSQVIHSLFIDFFSVLHVPERCRILIHMCVFFIPKTI
jgi:hypothetical protein